MVAGYSSGGGHVLHRCATGTYRGRYCHLRSDWPESRFPSTAAGAASFMGSHSSDQKKARRNLVPVPSVRRETGAGYVPCQHRRVPLAEIWNKRPYSLVPAKCCKYSADGAALPERAALNAPPGPPFFGWGGRAGGAAGAGGQRHHAVLHDGKKVRKVRNAFQPVKRQA